MPFPSPFVPVWQPIQSPLVRDLDVADSTATPPCMLCIVWQFAQGPTTFANALLLAKKIGNRTSRNNFFFIVTSVDRGSDLCVVNHTYNRMIISYYCSSNYPASFNVVFVLVITASYVDRSGGCFDWMEKVGVFPHPLGNNPQLIFGYLFVRIGCFDCR